MVGAPLGGHPRGGNPHARSGERELLELDEAYLDMAIVLCTRKVMELENLIFPRLRSGKSG